MNSCIMCGKTIAMGERYCSDCKALLAEGINPRCYSIIQKMQTQLEFLVNAEKKRQEAEKSAMIL